jgi:AraC-like DNA-binding protein
MILLLPGRTVYLRTNYYQLARMNEAARLLGRQSVSETSYQLSSTNLSHFGCLFEKHFQVKPKKYNDGVALR